MNPIRGPTLRMRLLWEQKAAYFVSRTKEVSPAGRKKTPLLVPSPIVFAPQQVEAVRQTLVDRAPTTWPYSV